VKHNNIYFNPKMINFTYIWLLLTIMFYYNTTLSFCWKKSDRGLAQVVFAKYDWKEQTVFDSVNIRPLP